MGVNEFGLGLGLNFGLRVRLGLRFFPYLIADSVKSKMGFNKVDGSMGVNEFGLGLGLNFGLRVGLGLGHFEHGLGI
jgi:hypothetical protein